MNTTTINYTMEVIIHLILSPEQQPCSWSPQVTHWILFGFYNSDCFGIVAVMAQVTLIPPTRGSESDTIASSHDFHLPELRWPVFDPANIIHTAKTRGLIKQRRNTNHKKQHALFSMPLLNLASGNIKPQYDSAWVCFIRVKLIMWCLFTFQFLILLLCVLCTKCSFVLRSQCNAFWAEVLEGTTDWLVFFILMWNANKMMTICVV